MKVNIQIVIIHNTPVLFWWKMFYTISQSNQNSTNFTQNRSLKCLNERSGIPWYFWKKWVCFDNTHTHTHTNIEYFSMLRGTYNLQIWGQDTYSYYPQYTCLVFAKKKSKKRYDQQFNWCISNSTSIPGRPTWGSFIGFFSIKISLKKKKTQNCQLVENFWKLFLKQSWKTKQL